MNDVVETRSVHDLHSLPESWTSCTLFELVTSSGIMTDGDWVETKDQDPNGEVRLIQLADIGDGMYLNRSYRFLTAKNAAALGCTFLARNDLLIARMADPVGRACIFPGDAKRCVTAVDVCIFRSGHSNVDHRWLVHIINSPAIRNRMESLAKGVTRKRISGANLKRIKVPLAPAREQQRTAEKIEELFSELDAGVASLKRARALLKKYRQAVLKAAVTGELTRDWRERQKGEIRESGVELLQRILKARRAAWEAAELRKLRAKGKPPKDDRWKQKYNEPQPPDTNGLPALPEGWVWASLPQLGEFGRGKSKHRPRNDQKLYGGNYPFIQTGVVREANGVINHFDQTYNKTGLAQSKLWPKGTMCITIAANIAETGILGFDACFPDSVVGLVPHSDVRVECIEYFMRTVREDLDRYAPATAQKNINLEILFEVAVPLPPIAEQEAVVSETERLLSVVDALEADIEQGLRHNDIMRQSVLKAAFAGQLVPQDPDDEPASVLLERIRAERAARPKSAHGRRRKVEASARQLELQVQ